MNKNRALAAFASFLALTACLAWAGAVAPDKVATGDANAKVLTHYCEAGNQPHMQAEPFDPASNQLRFDFAGGGSLSDVNVGHMHSVVLTFAGTDALNADWAWQENGKPGFHALLEFHRVR